jgi:hypothetical protein
MSPTKPYPTIPRRGIRSESGSILLLTALSMVMLLGVVALAIDGSYMYTERNRMAAAADAAAKSAAFERKRWGYGNSDLWRVARYEVAWQNLDPAIVVEVNNPPNTGTYSGDNHYVEVILAKTTQTFFARVLNPVWSSLTPRVRAVAGTATPSACFITMENLDIGRDTWNLHECAIEVGGDLSANNPTAKIIGPAFVTGNCPDCGGVRSNFPGGVIGAPPQRIHSRHWTHPTSCSRA